MLRGPMCFVQIWSYCFLELQQIAINYFFRLKNDPIWFKLNKSFYKWYSYFWHFFIQNNRVEKLLEIFIRKINIYWCFWFLNRYWCWNDCGDSLKKQKIKYQILKIKRSFFAEMTIYVSKINKSKEIYYFSFVI